MAEYFVSHSETKRNEISSFWFSCANDAYFHETVFLGERVFVYAQTRLGGFFFFFEYVEIVPPGFDARRALIYGDIFILIFDDDDDDSSNSNYERARWKIEALIW